MRNIALCKKTGVWLMVSAIITVAFAWAVAIAMPQPAWALVAGSAAPAQGQTFVVNGNKYKVTDAETDSDDMGEVRLVKYGSSNKKPVVNLVKYKGKTYEVDSIGKNAFNNAKGHRIVSLTVGRHVDTIGSKAFYGCSKLKTINMRKSDVIDIDKTKRGYEIDEVDIGSKAFTKAGTASVKVQCGSKSASYQRLFKKALVRKGMRQSVRVVK